MRSNRVADDPDGESKISPSRSRALLSRAVVEWIPDHDSMDVCEEPTLNVQANALDSILADDCLNLYIFLQNTPGSWDINEWGAGDNDTLLISMKTCAIALTSVDITKLPIT